METEEDREDVSQSKSATPIKAETTAEEGEDVSSGHTCGVCGRSFPLLSSLSQHMRRHTREKPYKCPYCELRTAQKGSLKAHIRSHKLGLFSQNHVETEPDGEQKTNTKTPELSKIVSASNKAHNVNGRVKKKAARKNAKGKDAVEAMADDDGSCTCTICGQTFPQVLLLKTHMKRHRGSQDHGCRICGRRFRQAWFLQSHMRIHRVKAHQLKGAGGKSADSPPATINGVSQDPASLTNEECLYELCAGCGNFFSDRKTLRAHERLHRPYHGRAQTQNPQQEEEIEASEQPISKARFLESLNLTCVNGPRETSPEKSEGGRISELDPVCSYQAWQLATKGRLVEVSEKCLGWEERLADAEVAYNTEKCEYVPLKQEKKRKPIATSATPGSNVKKMKVDQTPNGSAHTKGGDKRICQKDRILLNGLGHAFYEALQTKKVKEVYVATKQTNSSRSQDQDDKKTIFCEHCDFHTVDASLLRSHMHRQHQDFPGPYSSIKHSTILNAVSQSGSKASRYMDYLRNRSALLSQPYWNPYTCPPTEAVLKTEKGVKGQGHASNATTTDASSLLNLSSLPVNEGEDAGSNPVKTEGMVRHQCPYCAHTSNYPEVLWIHQRVAHRVDGGSVAAPKWAPCASAPNKSSKQGANHWRRTGPPPFLEGKDCPALPAPKTQRTQAPGLQNQGSNNSKNSAPTKTQSSNPKSKSKDSRPSEGSSGARIPQKKSSEHNRATEGGSKSAPAPATSSRTVVKKSNTSHSVKAASSPKHRSHRVPAESHNFPQEGLGFMLARNHHHHSSGSGTSSNAAPDRTHSRRQSCDSSSSSSSGPKGPDVWAAAMNMWAGHKAYQEPLRYAQGKNESAAEAPMDILSVLKNYSPHDLAALYQHWGFVDPRIDPQAMLQLNGHFAKEVHSSSEASKQVNSRSTSSSGSLHKGT